MSTIKVANLSEKTCANQLYNFLKRSGSFNIIKTEIECNPSGNSNCVAYVTFQNNAEARNAIICCDLKILDGNKLDITLDTDHSKVNSPRNDHYNIQDNCPINYNPINNKHHDILEMTSTNHINKNFTNDINTPMIEKRDKKQSTWGKSEDFSKSAITTTSSRTFPTGNYYNGDIDENTREMYLSNSGRTPMQKNYFNNNNDETMIGISKNKNSGINELNKYEVIETSEYDENSDNENDDIIYDQNGNNYSDDNEYDSNWDYDEENMGNAGFNQQFSKQKNQSHRSGYKRLHRSRFTDIELHNQKIFKETKRIVERGSYIDYKGIHYDIREKLIESIKETKTIDKNYDFTQDLKQKLNRRKHYNKNEINQILKNKIEVTDESTFAAARRLKNSTKEVCVLNFASATKPGGGVINGRTAQEETLSKQSNLYFSLKPQKKMYRYHKAHYDPYYTDFMIYSPNIVVFRDDDYNLISPFRVSVISSAAVNNSELLKQCFDYGKTNKKVNRCMKDRCRKILQLAMITNNKVLVLGAFGCGVFGNKPEDISKIFRDLLIEECYASFFTKIVFAIKGKPHRRNANFNAFNNEFKPYKLLT